MANGYRRSCPRRCAAGVHNFFGNLAEVDSVINYTLQGRLGRTVRSLGRFVINTHPRASAGCSMSPAKLNLPDAPTGFGTTLAKWGMHPGPYLVIPLYGPSTLREGIGLAADYGTSYAINLARSVPRVINPGVSASRMPSISARTSIFATTRPARRSNTRPSASSTCASN